MAPPPITKAAGTVRDTATLRALGGPMVERAAKSWREKAYCNGRLQEYNQNHPGTGNRTEKNRQDTRNQKYATHSLFRAHPITCPPCQEGHEETGNPGKCHNGICPISFDPLFRYQVKGQHGIDSQRACNSEAEKENHDPERTFSEERTKR